MLIRHFFTPGLFINSYLIFDEETRIGAIIDPTRQIEIYLARAMQEGIEITDILETHVHADFISGASELKAALKGKPQIHCSGLGGKEWAPIYADHLVKNRDTIQLGSVRLEAWHTPGHTPEHIIWVGYDEKRSKSIPEIAFTGDLLFVGSVGRPDLLGKEAEVGLVKQLYHSLFAVLHTLPDFVEIYPSHGAGSLCGKGIGMKLSSTLGYEKRCNPWLMPQDYKSWLNSLQLGASPIPAYFKQMKEVNIKGPALSQHQEMPRLFSKEDVKKHLLTDLIMDLRRPSEFASENIKGSINIPFTPSFPLWVGAIVSHDKDILLVIDHPETLVSIIRSLSLIGIDRISGFTDINHWKLEDKKELLSPSPMISVDDLYTHQMDYYLIDVRNQHEWDQGHIASAHHIDLVKVPQVFHDIPTDKPIAVICHSGNRASIIASLLEKEKQVKTWNVKGGMQAWLQAELPVSQVGF